MPGKWMVEPIGGWLKTLLNGGYDGSLSWVDGGLAVPAAFPPVVAFNEEAEARLEIEIVSADSKIRAHKVTIETDSPRGVTAALLRDLPVRFIVRGAVRELLVRVDTSGPKGPAYMPVGKLTDREAQAVQRAIGYVEVER